MEQNIANDANNHGRDYRAMNGRIISRADQYQELMDHLDAANEERKRSIREKNTAENSVQERRLELEAKMEGKLISDGAYRSYALDIVSPAIEYFIAQMIVPLKHICKGPSQPHCKFWWRQEWEWISPPHHPPRLQGGSQPSRYCASASYAVWRGVRTYPPYGRIWPR